MSGFFYGLNICMSDQAYIYESPDGGHTVYRRSPGYVQRELVSMDQTAQDRLSLIREDQFWKEARLAAKNDPGLAELLDRVRIYYKLKYEKD